MALAHQLRRHRPNEDGALARRRHAETDGVVLFPKLSLPRKRGFGAGSGIGGLMTWGRDGGGGGGKWLPESLFDSFVGSNKQKDKRH